MAGLELVVRPVVFPNIRPATPRVLPPPDDPTQGFCTLSGSGGRLIDLPHTYSSSFSSSAPKKEVKRQFDKERIYQVDDDGNINKKNFVDVERLKKIQLTDDGPFSDPEAGHTEGAGPFSDPEAGHSANFQFDDPPRADNVETLESDVTRRSGG